MEYANESERRRTAFRKVRKKVTNGKNKRYDPKANEKDRYRDIPSSTRSAKLNQDGKTKTFGHTIGENK